MYRFWQTVIEPVLDEIEAGVVVEIGSDQGHNTKNLLHYGRSRGATIHVIDPLPKYDVDEWLAEYSEVMVFHRELSLKALEGIDTPDAVLIDGDHNWYTVFHELKALEELGEKNPSRFPVVLLHDVGWPYGRRDLYYDPETIPPPDRQPHDQAGMRPGNDELDPDGGFNAHLSNALHEGGRRNGVLTAVEDFIDEASVELDLVIVPAINGLGILYPRVLAEQNTTLAAFLRDLADATRLLGILEDVEEERISALVDGADARKDLAQTRKSLRDRETELRVSEQERSAERSRLQSELTEAGSRLSAVQGELDRARGELKSIEDEMEAANAELDRSKAELESSKEELEASQAELGRSRDQLERANSAAKSLRKDRTGLQKKLEASNRRYERLRSRRSVRAALRVAALAKPLFGNSRESTREISRRSSASDPSAEPAKESSGSVARPPQSLRTQTRLASELTRRRPGSQRTSGPLVSIIVLTRNGSSHLERLLPSLETTKYRSFEVIVVDNGSTDSTAEVLNVERGFPLRVIRNEHNTSFSVGNNQGADQAGGQYLLLLNNDVEPINSGWLGSMVDALETEQFAVACGALLVYPVRGDAETDLTVQHSGTRFTFMKRGVRAVNVANPDPLEDGLAEVVEVPAATAAALLVDRGAFDAVGGLTEGYVYGTEDVDLCLKLKDRGGRILVNGQAMLFHHESATQDTIASEITRINRAGNRQLLMETWGPRLTRSVQRDRLLGAHGWSKERSRTVAITLTHDDVTKGWGDYYTAHELGDAFSRAGWDVVYAERYQDRWYELGEGVDLVISLLDAFDVRRAPEGALTVAWVRNWVDRWLEHPWFDSFDIVATSSHAAAELIAHRSRFDPVVVPLATNPARFSPGPPNPTFQSDYAFTGNNWGHGRDLISLLDIHPEEHFLLFGKGWDNDPRAERYWRGHLDYSLLPELYRSAKIVLDDTAAPTLPYAFVNGRVFDALGAGALVISDNVEGSAEMFGGELPTYTDREELRAHLDHYLNNEADRLELVERLRERVVSEHTYASRPQTFVDLMLDHLEQPKAAIKIGVPREEEMENWGDTHFARALASGLTKIGVPTEIHILPEWDLPQNQAVDVVIHIRGLTTYAPKPAHVNVLWIISHPDDVTVRECEKYDLVLVASKSHAEHLRSLIETPVVFMPQATDERKFHVVEPNDDLVSEVLFVGNSRGQARPAVDWSLERGLPLTVYGRDWNGRVPYRNLRGDYFPNDQLAHLYASAKVVLNDHWPDMRERGFVSNRVFDALASGAAVVSDRAEGLEDLFGDLVPTFDSPGELEENVEALLEDDEMRRRIVKEAATLVAESHTFTRRAEHIKELIAPMLADKRKDLEGATFAF